MRQYSHVRLICCLALVGVLWCVRALAFASVSVIPKPQSLNIGADGFTVTADTCLRHDPALEDTAEYLRDVLAPVTGFKLSAEGEYCITLSQDPGLEGEAYRLTIDKQGVRIWAADEAGAFYAVQTLRQLLPPSIYARQPQTGVAWRLPGVGISDRPRFAWRGMMLDVARHFMPKEAVMRFIDALAMHKMNRLHLHLTDNQGWRVEIKRYPRLTDIGAWRESSATGFSLFGAKQDGTPHGGFYTQEDIREMVAYAAHRHVTLVPEIDVPGHSQAAIAAYPELGNLSTPLKVSTEFMDRTVILNAEESTVTFYENVLSEVMELFPSQYIHVGGDEAVKDQWEQSPRAQQRIQELGLLDENDLQTWFINRLNEYLSSQGRTTVGWDDVLTEGLSQDTLLMVWRSPHQDNALRGIKTGHPLILTPSKPTYFDFYQASSGKEPPALPSQYNLLEDVYGFEPMPEGLSKEESAQVKGTQGQLWTELIKTPSHMEYMAFPRTSALAEVAWLNPEHKDYADFQRRLSLHTQRLEHMGVNYREPGDDALSLMDKLQVKIGEWVAVVVHVLLR